MVSDFQLPRNVRRKRPAKRNRPSLTDAASPEEAEPLYDALCAESRALGVRVATGRFGARMAVELANDGPITLVLVT